MACRASEATWVTYKRHYGSTQKQATINRLRKAGYEEGRDWIRRETEGKTTEFLLRGGLERPEDIPSTPKPWLVTAQVDGERIEETYSARRKHHARVWFRQDKEWQGHEIVNIITVEAA